MATKQRVITTAVAGTVITFKVAGAGECALDLDNVDVTLKDRAMFHGFIQRVSDAAALDRGATAEEKLAEMARLCDHYNSGSSEWRIAGTGNGGQDSLVVLAMQRVYGGSVADQEAYLAKMCAKRGIHFIDCYVAVFGRMPRKV